MGDRPKSAYVELPISILKNTSLSRDARLLWAILKDYQGGNGHGWPAIPQLASDMGCTPRQIGTYLNELSAAGFLSRKRTQRASHYSVQIGSPLLKKPTSYEAHFLADRKPASEQIGSPLPTNDTQEREPVTRTIKTTRSRAPRSPGTGGWLADYWNQCFGGDYAFSPGSKDFVRLAAAEKAYPVDRLKAAVLAFKDSPACQNERDFKGYTVDGLLLALPKLINGSEAPKSKRQRDGNVHFKPEVDGELRIVED